MTLKTSPRRAAAFGVALAAALAHQATPAHAEATFSRTLTVEADSFVRTDLDIRRNDNHGMQQYLMVGTGRGGGGQPWGAADAMRSLLRFNLSGLPTEPLVGAELEMRISGIGYGHPHSVFRLQVHRIVPSGDRTPWVEGNGFEFTPWDTVIRPAGSVFTDDAYGVAWAGAGDNPAPDAANNTTQPDFDASVEATSLVDRANMGSGDVVRWNITDLVKRWIAGAVPNLGMVLRDPTTDDDFREIYLGAKDGALLGSPDPNWHGPPRLVLVFRAEPASKDECKDEGWMVFQLLQFKNQGDCVSYVVTHGRNQPAAQGRQP